MTKIYTLLLLCLFALTLPVTAREAEFKKIKESWTLQADGTQVYRQSKVLTLYTHTAMNRTYGESFITYDPRYQTLQIPRFGCNGIVQIDGSWSTLRR